MFMPLCNCMHISQIRSSLTCVHRSNSSVKKFHDTSSSTITRKHVRCAELFWYVVTWSCNAFHQQLGRLVQRGRALGIGSAEYRARRDVRQDRLASIGLRHYRRQVCLAPTNRDLQQKMQQFGNIFSAFFAESAAKGSWKERVHSS